ncbi:MAG: recombinase family protein [Propionibacterium sp.]
MTYQRVSTKEQTARGGRDEGFSIPAQREANGRKAEALGARIVAEFVDAGESARSADRPDLKRMLDYIASPPRSRIASSTRSTGSHATASTTPKSTAHSSTPGSS